ncbi:MAG: polysaccharide pyruvyl transferase family protein [Campylobacterales bacterium]|nr:polysaccharide pyruvyl transferase family protein [Campylobacterales bacterium]
MKVLVIGWYGTETIGDRAILAGMIQLLTKVLGSIDLVLGSLFPFFSERTIYEDKETISKTSYASVNFSIIDTSNSLELKKAVINSDLVVMGGGPLMDLSELYMVDYAFKLAKKKRKKTAILGCGVGPLFHKHYRKTVLSIVKNSDVTVLRDTSSKNNLEAIYLEFSKDFSECAIEVGFDPAVHYTYRVNEFIKLNSDKEYISINLRSFPSEYSVDEKKGSVNSKLVRFVGKLAESFPETEILLTPMHYFHIGDDDRYFLNEIKFKLGRDNLRVQNETLSLEETVKVYTNAKFNIGMRFHSVVLQTISSGKNYILDYTQPKKGKISGFIGDIDKSGFYEQRYICLQDQAEDFSFDYAAMDSKFVVSPQLVEQSENTYLSQIRKLNLS